MENKKQLVIVPPVSEPLKKLNEVLDTIASDENIEISLIDDLKELSQFIGSAGQSLVMFSNAKKCASFLQENKFVLAKTHSKVILLTPKEIPAKTLVKFVKLGLTEAILENSPPKTLLYKVKLLLRSIKTSTASPEDKDQVIKSMIDLTGGSAKSDAVAEEEKAATSAESFNYLEDRKNKKSQEENTIDYGEGMKGEVTPEEAMDTHWKSKRKKDIQIDLDEAQSEKLENAEENIDMYYRGKQKKDTGVAFDESEMHHQKKAAEELTEAYEDDKGSKKIIDDEDTLDTEKKKSNYVEEDTSPLSVKLKKEFVLDLDAAAEPEVRELTEEEKAAQKKKDFDELEALFEAAKKRQAEQSEDYGGHYKGKVLNNEEVGEELEAIETKEYDNSELAEKEKTAELDLIASEADEDNDKEVDTNETSDPHEGEVDHIETNMVGKTNSPDIIESDNMMSDIGEDSSKKISTFEIDMLDKPKKNEEETESSERDKKKLESEASADDDFREKNEPDYNKDNDDDRKKDFDLDLISGSNKDDREKEATNYDVEDDYLKTKKQAAGLSLVDGDDDDASKSIDDDDLDLSLQKLTRSDLVDENNDPHVHEGKVDKIDTYFRSTTKKDPDHNWDNLAGKKNDSLQLEKGAKPNDEKADYNLNRKDAGEVTIDYRKLKEEFSSMDRARGTDSDEDSIYKKTRGEGFEDDEASSRVIIVDPRGFDFGIGVVNLIYQKDNKPIEFYKKIAEEIITQYKGYPVFYTYKSSDNKHSEAFDSIMHFSDSVVSTELKEWWHTYKTQNVQNFDEFYNKSMTTWICRHIEDKKNPNGHWEDVELPAWAANELNDKEVELIFPYFDGVDRMGVAVIFFPKGINPKFEKSLSITLELARTVQLDTIQRKIAEAPANKNNDQEETTETATKKAGLFSSIFNRKKAG